MKRLIGSLLTRLIHNIGYKLLALVLAVWWWAYAQSQQNPRETRTVSVQTQLSRANGLMLPDGPPVVRVRIRGLRDDLNEFDLGSLTARLDLRDAAPGKTQSLPVIISAPLNSPVEILDREVPVKVMVDKKESKRQAVEYRVVDVPAQYQVSSVTFDPAEVILRGPLSRLQRVRHAWVRLRLNSARPPSFPPKLSVEAVDQAGVVVSDIEVIPPRVGIAVEIQEIRAFPVAPHLVGSPAMGFRLTKLDYEPKTVLLAGAPDVLKSITEVPTEPVDIGGAQDDLTRRVGLQLPDGVTAQDPQRVRVEVQIIRQPLPPPVPENDEPAERPSPAASGR